MARVLFTIKVLMPQYLELLTLVDGAANLPSPLLFNRIEFYILNAYTRHAHKTADHNKHLIRDRDLDGDNDNDNRDGDNAKINGLPKTLHTFVYLKKTYINIESRIQRPAMIIGFRAVRRIIIGPVHRKRN